MNHFSIRPLFLAMALVGQAGFAEPIGLRFTGQLFEGGTLFGVEIAPTDPVVGYVIYDPTAPLTDQPLNCVDCGGYQQDLVGGFLLEVGPLTVWSNSYQTNVINNQVGLFPGTFEDVLGFEHIPASDLLVNGTAQPAGSIDLGLTASDTTFVGHQLPQDPAPLSFPIGNLLIQDGGANALLLGMIDSGSLQRFDVVSGDLDLDEVISDQDYQVWESNFGSTTSPHGDANRDGRIDAADYTVWRDARNQAGLAVPEPSCGMLCLLAWVSRPALSRRSGFPHV